MADAEFSARPGGMLLVAGGPIRCFNCLLYGRQEYRHDCRAGRSRRLSFLRVMARFPIGPGRLGWCGRPFVLRTGPDWCCGILNKVSAGTEAGGEVSVVADGSVMFRIRSVPLDAAARDLEGHAAAMEEVACRVGCWGPYLDWLEDQGDARRYHLDLLFGRQPVPGGSGLPPGAPAR
jgi:hypothetical protein